MDFTLLNGEWGTDPASTTNIIESITDMFGGVTDIITNVVISVWPVLIGLFLLVGVFFWLKRKATGIAR